MNRLVYLFAGVVAVVFTFDFQPVYGDDSIEPVASPAASGLPHVHPEYKIGPGDSLRITEWRNEDLTLPVVVLPDGYISFPLVGDLPVAGRTVPELKAEIEARLKIYIPEPTVSVMVTNVQSLLVYVIGRVQRPGVFTLNTNITVLQSLAMAGGLNPFAKRGQIKVLRGAGAETQVFIFDYDKVSAGKNLEQNIVLERGDIIVVP